MKRKIHSFSNSREMIERILEEWTDEKRFGKAGTCSEKVFDAVERYYFFPYSTEDLVDRIKKFGVASLTKEEFRHFACMYHLMSVMMEEDKEIEYRYGEIGVEWLDKDYISDVKWAPEEPIITLEKNKLYTGPITFDQLLRDGSIDDERKYSNELKDSDHDI